MRAKIAQLKIECCIQAGGARSLQAWAALDVTVEEGLHQLQALCSTEVKVEGGGSCLRAHTQHGCHRFARRAEDSPAGRLRMCGLAVYTHPRV